MHRESHRVRRPSSVSAHASAHHEGGESAPAGSRPAASPEPQTGSGRPVRDPPRGVSEAFLAQAQRLTKTGSLWWKPSTGAIVWSEGNYDLMGYPVGITPTVELALDRCHPEDVARVQEVLGRAISEGSGVEFEHRLLMPDGAVKHVRVVWENVGTADDPEFLGAATDITAWKEAEERLRRSEAYLADAQRLSGTGNFGWRVGDEHLVWSDETFRIFAVDPTTPVTRRSVLDLVHPEDVDAVERLMSQAEAGREVDYEYRILTPGGLVKYVHLVAHCARDRDGRREVVGVIQDVSAQRRSEEALGRLQSELAHVTRVASVGALTASIAHEVNQPLAGVVANASTCVRMLERESPNLERARTTARRAIRDAMRASEVIAHVRALVTRATPTAGPVDLNEATREVVALSRGELQRARTTARLELAADLPLVSGDRVQLQQVVLNLLRNALEAMAGVAGRPKEVVIRTTAGDDGPVTLSVCDAGEGVDPRGSERLFDAFYTTKPGGMGVGLSVSRSIVESHGGHLWAAPNEGPGATFTFSVPRSLDRGAETSHGSE